MKKILSVLACVLLLLIVFLPMGVLITSLLGYTFALTYPWVFIGAMVAVAAALVLLSALTGETVDNKIIQIVFSLLTPCALINTAFYLRACGSVWLVISLFLCVGCGYLTMRQGNPQVVRLGALVLSASLMLPMVLICFLLLVAGSTQVNTVVQTVDSPSGVCYAEVISSDQGAMGGDTVVNVHTGKEIDLGFVQIHKKHQRVYLGKQDEYKTMDIQWKNDNCLLIDGKEYPIK